jgi:hypothetical protein
MLGDGYGLSDSRRAMGTDRAPDGESSSSRIGFTAKCAGRQAVVDLLHYNCDATNQDEPIG